MNFQEAFFDELEKIAERRSLNKEAGVRSNLLSALLGLGALAGTANIAREGFKHPGPSGVANIATTLARSKDSPPLLLRRPGTPGAPKPFKKLGVDFGSFARNVVDFIPDNPGEAFQYAKFYANAARHRLGTAWDNFWTKPGSYKRLPRNNFERVTGKIGNIKLATEKLGEFDPNAVSNALNAMDSSMPGYGPTDTLMAVTKYYGPQLKGAGSKISDLIKKLVAKKRIKI